MVTGRTACQAGGKHQLYDPEPKMLVCRGVSTSKVLAEMCAQKSGASSLISWVGCACDECGGGSGCLNGEPYLRDPIHGFRLLRSQEASDPERIPHMLPCAPLKAKWPASGRGAKLCLADRRSVDRMPRHGGSRLSTRAAHAVHVCLASPYNATTPLSSTRQSSLLLPQPLSSDRQ
jgi:hypothetical protein